ncbi:MAG: PAS domain S-box protein [Magnetospirillum sp.]|nr:PAS domain S-box protein [Magnetospirillum sp.]
MNADTSPLAPLKAKGSRIERIRLESAEQERLIRFQQSILESVALGRAHEEVTRQLCDLAERMVPNSAAVVMLLDGHGVLNVHAAPSIPAEGVACLNGLRPGAGAGSCGNAVYRRKPVYVRDTLTAPEWQDLRRFAIDFNLKACWSTPIRSGNRIVGTFALSSFEHRLPSPFQQRLLDIGASVLAILLERQRQAQTLRASESRFHDMVETVSDWIWEVDAEWRYTYVSPRVSTLLGYAPQDVLGKTPFDLMRPAEAPRLRDFYRAKAAAKTPLMEETARIHREGFTVLLDVSGVPILDADERIVGFRGIARDVTARRRMEAEIEESETRYRALFDGSPEGIMVVVGGTVRLVNPSAASLFGTTTVEQLTGTAVLDRIHPDDRDTVAQRMREVTDRRIAAAPLELVLLATDGTPFDAEVWAHPAVLGGEAAVMAVIRDITRRKAMHAELRRHRDFNNAIFNSVSSLVAVIDRQGAIVRLNRAAEEFTGYRTDEAREPFFWKNFLPPEQSARVNAVFRNAVKGTIARRYENEWVRRDGTRRVFDWTNDIVCDADGRMEYLVTIGTDITERRQAEQAVRESEERYRALFTHSKVAMLLIDPSDGAIVDANDAAGRYYGYSVDRLKSLAIGDINIMTGAELAVEMAEASREHRSHFFFRHRLANSEVRDVEVHSGPLELGGRTLLFSIIHDISERRHAEEALRLAANVFAHTQEGILVTDTAGTILDVNPAFTRLTGYERDEIVGRSPRMLQSGRQGAEFYRAMWESLRTTGHWNGEVWNRRKSGEIYPQWLDISAVRDQRGRPTHFVAVFHDISLLKRQEEALAHIAHHDALTGLPNRMLLADRMRQAIADARRGGWLVAVAYMDLDGFKPVNDLHGHAAGDALLVEIGGRIGRCLRGGDTVARLGGDEFVVLLPGLRGSAEYEAVLRRIAAAIAEPFTPPGTTAAVTVTASIGVSVYPDDDTDPDILLRYADQAMYRAKQAGKGQIISGRAPG